MQAMIFAAGLGTRLKPFTNYHPKSLAIVGGKYLIQRNIEYLKSFGINFVVINVFHFAEQIIQVLKNNDGFGIKYIVSNETPDILETGGGFANAFSFFNKNLPILTLNADILTNYNLFDFIDFHNKNKNFISIAVSERKSSRVLLIDTNNNLVGWKNLNTNDEKIISNINEFKTVAFSGISIFDYSIKEYFLKEKKYSLIDLFLSVGKIKPIKAFKYNTLKHYFIDVGNNENIIKAESIIRDNFNQ